jgi:alkanesulfonate monooxygenase SsuD/methylene tetrahydromethanopterin reductase-like flavin-dependent oxidoreductase (luciferase family)
VRIADGYFPGEGDIEQLSALLNRVRQAAEKAGRDPASIEFSAIFGSQIANPEKGVEEMASIGVDRIMIPAFFFAGPEGLDSLDQLSERIMPVAAG